jgi:hypothetical protein
VFETWDVFYSVCGIRNYHWQRMSNITEIWGLQLILSPELTLLIVKPPSTLIMQSVYLILP